MHRMTRGEFIAGGGVGVVAADFLFAGPRPLLKEDYSVSLLGDIHYDCPPIDRFHSEFRRPLCNIQLAVRGQKTVRLAQMTKCGIIRGTYGTIGRIT